MLTIKAGLRWLGIRHEETLSARLHGVEDVSLKG